MRWKELPAECRKYIPVDTVTGRVMYEHEGCWNLSYKHPADKEHVPVFMLVSLDFLQEYLLRHWPDFFKPSFENCWCWRLTCDTDPSICVAFIPKILEYMTPLGGVQ
jgi:hypothetical protein